MSGNETLRRGVGSPADAAQLIADKYGLPPDHARQLIRDGLQSGEIGAVVVALYGERRIAVPADDLTDDKIDFADKPEIEAPALIADAAEPDAWAIGRIIRIVQPEIEINLAAAGRYAGAIYGEPPNDNKRVQPKNPGGRPVEHDWRRATRQVLLRVRDYGWPATKAELIAELVAWFARSFSEPPDESTVRRFVSAIWPQGRCELEPRD